MCLMNLEEELSLDDLAKLSRDSVIAHRKKAYKRKLKAEKDIEIDDALLKFIDNNKR